MSFLSRAHKAYDRGDKVRAVVTLIEGLKRKPDHTEALDFLLRLYGIEVDGMGLEIDVVKILELQPDGDDLLSVLVDNARGCGHERVAEALLEFGQARGLSYLPPESDVESDTREIETDETERVESETDATKSFAAAESEVLPAGDDSELPVEWLSDIDELGERSAPVIDSDELAHEENNEPPLDAEATSTPTRDASSPIKPGRKVRERVTRTEERARQIRKRYIFIGIVVVAVIAASIFGYQEVQRVSAEARVEAALATTAPHRRDATHAQLDKLDRLWRETSSVHDRLAFTRAYIAWVDDASFEPTPIGDSPWAMGSLAIGAAQRGDLEEAIEMTTRAERTDAAAVPALIARAIVEEERQRWSASDRAWANVSERDPDVVAAYEGRARNAWRRMDTAQLNNSLDALERRDSKHPFLVLRTLLEPFGVVENGLVVAPQSEFLRAVELFRRARVGFARGEHGSAVEAADELQALEPDGVAALQHGVVLAHAYNPDGALQAFERAALTEGTTGELRLRLQSYAPEVLSGIGRPDLSERFETTLPGNTSRERAELRLPALRRSAIDSVRDSRWAVRAIFAHVNAVAQRGEYEAAQKLYEYLESREVQPDRARWEAALLRLQIERNVREPGLEGEELAVWRAASDYLDGEFEQVNALTGLPTEGALGEAARRYQILSLIASRRVAIALQLLEEERGKVSASSDGLRARTFARQARENSRFQSLFTRMIQAEPVGVERLSDLAAAAFWQGQVDAASKYSDAALALQEGHRQANWIKGLILRQRGEFNTAEGYLRKSGRDWDDTSGLLIELGYVSLALENWDEARKSFYKAFLKNRESIEAVRGLGTAYAAADNQLAVRDLARIESGLPKNARFSPVRAEVLRWLAVVEGVREGNEAALGYLSDAMKEVGRRPDLLVEQARYHEARSDRVEARKLYAAALQGNTTLASAHLGLARTALQDGDESVARDHLERYLEVEPRGEGASWARKRLTSLDEEQ